jgi:hypothetical protein
MVGEVLNEKRAGLQSQVVSYGNGIVPEVRFQKKRRPKRVMAEKSQGAKKMSKRELKRINLHQSWEKFVGMDTSWSGSLATTIPACACL